MRRLRLKNFFLALLVIGGLVSFAQVMKKSDHFNGKKFYNPYGQERSFWEVLQWFWERTPSKWPDEVPIEQQKVKHERVGFGELWVTFINHATALIQVDGLNILTDPMWSERASPFSWIGPKRVIAPGVKFEELPPIDIVLISHNHYDHMDKKTLRRLEQRDHPRFFTGLGNKEYLEGFGLKDVTELDWWESVEIAKDSQVVFVPSQHFSARTLWDRNETLWGGFMILCPGHRIYFAGDTGYSPFFKQIRERLGAPTFSLLPIGAFKPEWFMKTVHMGPYEAVQAFLDLNSEKAMAIHFGTFQLSDEGYEEPPDTLKEALKEYNISLDRFWILKNGEGRQVK